MKDLDKELLIEAHRARWSTFWTWAFFFTCLVLAEGLLAWTVYHEYLIPAIVTTLIIAHLMHSQLLAFHEAGHGILCPNRWVNEAAGVFIGLFHFVGLSLFRAVHKTHHAHLAEEHDEQLWPFTQPQAPRWSRRLAAACELSMGIVFDSLQIWRSFFRRGSPIQHPEIRRRVWMEFGLNVVFWSTIFAITAWFDGWMWLLTLYVIPALIAGNMYSLRKYVEHMGLTGSTVMGLTRSVVHRSALGRLLEFTMFNISFHGVHHYFAKMPQVSLPQFASELRPETPDERPVFPSYWHAFLDMLPTLADPKVGPQWRRQPAMEVVSCPLATSTETTSVPAQT